MTPNSNEIFSTRVVVESDQGIALVRRATTGEFKRAWELPGGKVDPDEHLFIAAIREAKEEIGLDVELLNYEALPIEERVIPDGKHKGKLFHSFGFVAIAHSDEIQLSPEHTEFRWVGSEDDLEATTLTPTSYNTLRMLSPLLLNPPKF